MKNLFFLFGFLFLISCGNQQSPKEQEPSETLVVATVNYPLNYFAQRIGGELIQVDFPIPADVDPAYWIPNEKALEVYQSADIIFTNGANYAKWMNNVSLPASRIVNTSFASKNNYIELKEVSTHSHGPEGEHEHTGYAFTTWLDFELASAQAEAIEEVLLKKLPEHKDALGQNFNSLNKDIEALNENMKQLAGEIGDQHILGSHPVYQYLSKAYGLKIHSVHFEPNEIPTKDQWKEFYHLLDHYPSKLMLWEDEPLPEVKEILIKKGIQVVIFNPCGNKPTNGDFISVMNANIEGLLKK